MADELNVRRLKNRVLMRQQGEKTGLFRVGRLPDPC